MLFLPFLPSFPKLSVRPTPTRLRWLDQDHQQELARGAWMAVVEGTTSSCTSSGRQFINLDDTSTRREGSLSAKTVIPGRGIPLVNADRMRYSDEEAVKPTQSRFLLSFPSFPKTPSLNLNPLFPSILSSARIPRERNSTAVLMRYGLFFRLHKTATRVEE